MGERLLMKGTEALAEAAIRAGAQIFFGYPITPQNESPEYFQEECQKLEGNMCRQKAKLQQ